MARLITLFLTGYSKGGPDTFVPSPVVPGVQRPPESGPLAWIVAAVALVAAGLCLTLFLVVIF